MIYGSNPLSSLASGDNRVNEQLQLAVMHIVMMREHNRLAEGLAHVNPHWDDETLYQEARHILSSELQHVTYSEFLPMVLGHQTMKKYDLVPLNKVRITRIRKGLTRYGSTGVGNASLCLICWAHF